jgi:prevent-host-death family protein
VTTTGLRELRQQASELVRRAEAGETIVVTVNGREVAQLGPVRRHQWRRAADVAPIFAGPPDPEWDADRDLLDDTISDPFSR